MSQMGYINDMTNYKNAKRPKCMGIDREMKRGHLDSEHLYAYSVIIHAHIKSVPFGEAADTSHYGRWKV